MIYNTTGAATRHTLSPRTSAAGQEPMVRHATFTAMLSTIELRRLVAEMVD